MTRLLLLLIAMPGLVGCRGAPEVETDQPPIAFAGWDQVYHLELDETGQPVPVKGLLDGRGSLDPDEPEAPLAYLWKQVHGPSTPEAIDPERSYQRVGLVHPGLHVFSLRVRSMILWSEPDSVGILIVPRVANQPPVPVFHFTPEAPLVGTEVLLDARESSDPDPGDFVVAYLWSLNEPSGMVRQLQGGRETSFLPTEAGVHEVSLSVSDTHGLVGTVVQTIAVIECAPGVPEVCNGLDDDCDGETDEGFDEDGNGVADCFECNPKHFPQIGQACNTTGCTPGVWVCLEREGTPELLCEPALHLVDELRCGLFERNGPAFYRADASGRLVQAQKHELRLQYDEVLEVPVFLMEGSRTNYVRLSESLDQDPWRRWSPAAEEQVRIEAAPEPGPDQGTAMRLSFTRDSQAVYQTGLLLRNGAFLGFSVYLRAARGSVGMRVEAGGDQLVLQATAEERWARFSGSRSWEAGAAGEVSMVLRRQDEREAELQVDAWGFQVEEGSFPSSYIRNDDSAPLVRPADQASFHAAFLSPGEGTLSLWMRPLYPAGASEPGLVILEVLPDLRCDYHGAEREIRCELGEIELSLDAEGFGPEGWSFIALSWGSETGCGLYLGIPETGGLHRASHAGAFPLEPPAQEDAIRPLPRFSHCRDIRIYGRSLSQEELQELFDQDLPGYLPRP